MFTDEQIKIVFYDGYICIPQAICSTVSINIQKVCTILNRRYSNARTDLAHVCVFILIVLSLAFDHHANQRVAKALLNRFAAA